MRWTVEAADVQTGEETTLTVEAPDQAAAERIARYRGMLVSSILQNNGNGAAKLDRKAPTPDYIDILTGAGVLRTLAIIITAIGWVCLLVAGALSWSAVKESSDKLAALWQAMSPALFGLSFIVAGTVLRMAASVGLAMRDLARNSFRGVD